MNAAKQSSIDAGFAISEAALALLVLLPVALSALAVWNYLSTVNELSEFVSRQLAHVEARSIELTNGEDDITGRLNQGDLSRAVDVLVQQTENKLRAQMAKAFSAYRIEAVLVDRSPHGGGDALGYRVLHTRSSGVLDTDNCFTSAAHLVRTAEADQTQRQPAVLSQQVAGIGLAVTLRPAASLFGTLFGEKSAFNRIHAAKMLDLRGEYVWR